MNCYICLGRITHKIELRYTTSNKAVVKVTLAINNGKDDTSFIPITFFDKMAENVSKYCDKGAMISVTATVRNCNWEDKEGKKHYDYNFVANKVTFISNKTKEIVEEKNEETKDHDPFQEFGDMIEVNDNFLD